MEQFSPNEVANFAVGLITLLLIVFVFSRAETDKLKPFFWGFLFMLAASFFTILEEVIAGEFLNFLEHLSFALAAWAFFAACLHIGRRGRSSGV